MDRRQTYQQKLSYYSPDLDYSQWEVVRDLMQELLDRKIDSTQSLQDLILHRSELTAILQEEFAWRYIEMTCYADQDSPRLNYQSYLVNVISPSKPLDFELKKKIFQGLKKYPDPENMSLYQRILSNEMDLFRMENVPLHEEEEQASSEYGAMISQLTTFFQELWIFRCF